MTDLLDTVDLSLSGLALKDLFERQGKAARFPLPWSEMDRMLYSLFPEELTVIAGRPSMGKTAVITQLAWWYALKNLNVLFLSLEMSTGQIFFRVASHHLGLDNYKFRSSTFTTEEQERLVAFSDVYSSSPLQVYDEIKTVQEIMDLVERVEPQYREACRRAEIRLEMELMLLHQLWIARHGNARRLVKSWKKAERKVSFFERGL